MNILNSEYLIELNLCPRFLFYRTQDNLIIIKFTKGKSKKKKSIQKNQYITNKNKFNI